MPLAHHSTKESSDGFYIESNNKSIFLKMSGKNILRSTFLHSSYKICEVFLGKNLAISTVVDEGKAVNDVGRFAIWFFDGNLNYIGNNIANISKDIAKNFVHELLDLSWLHHLDDEWPDEEYIVKTGVYKALYDLIHGNFSTVSDKVVISQASHDYDRKDISFALAAEIGHTQDDALQNGRLRLPLNQEENQYIDFHHSIYVEDLRMAYLNFESNLPAYVAMTGPHHAALSGIWDVRQMKVYCSAYMRQEASSVVPHAILKLLRWARKVRSYVAQRPNATYVPVQISHLGHHLVNELSGLDRVTNIDSEKLSKAVIAKIGLGEPFGPVEDIVPALRSMPAISCDSPTQFEKFLFATNGFFVRLTGNYINSRLSLAVNRVCEEKTRAWGSDLLEFDSSHRSGERRIVIGLRVENRTWDNQAGNIIECLKFIKSRNEKLIAFIDGHNSTGKDPSKIYPSFSGTGNADKETIEAELKILSEVEAAFRGDETIKIVSLIQRSVQENIYILNQCDYFIAPWGAGLAKYKWVSNMEGVVVSSRWNLDNRPDLSIYEEGGLREGARTSSYIGKDSVEDLPDGPRLIDNWGHPSFWNYRITSMSDLFRLIAEVDDRTKPQHSSPR